MIMTIVDWNTVVSQFFVFLIALVTAGAGVWMLWLGYKLTVAQTRLEGLGDDKSPAREAIRETVHNANAITESASAVTAQAATVAEAAGNQGSEATPDNDAQSQQPVDQVQSASQAATTSIGPTADYVRALAELTKNLSSLTPAVSAFVVSTILFITAGTIVALNSI